MNGVYFYFVNKLFLVGRYWDLKHNGQWKITENKVHTFCWNLVYLKILMLTSHGFFFKEANLYETVVRNYYRLDLRYEDAEENKYICNNDLTLNAQQNLLDILVKIVGLLDASENNNNRYITMFDMGQLAHSKTGLKPFAID